VPRNEGCRRVRFFLVGLSQHQENSTSVEHIEKLESDRNPRLTEATKRQTRRVILTRQQVRLELIKRRVALGTPARPRSDEEITSSLRDSNLGLKKADTCLSDCTKAPF
jgi:hypothetical protein